ncbi:uncharacterized protein si:ch73-100l22.3 isoform X2 [Brienomyrus brachyistius]|uniref:uncharacterized protein si:ch73-100l22.3 isoform X2 n=1 Tax=Brienomyrus brachyistius TaxID=42636 RepID=UPI0020B29E9E|nr:uncharacterized protein si:ch73-100l22.3 isoform X2 [Brienomyrus brachyistius]
MEEYEAFARRRLAQLGEAAGARDSARSAARPVNGGSSCIRFHGVAVLPPLLTEQQRELMRGYKVEAMRLLRQRGTAQPDSRVSQLRKVPTLQEFIQNEPDVVGTGSATWDFPPPLCSTAKPMHDGKRDEFSFHHLTSISSVTLGATDSPDLTGRTSLVPDTRCALVHGSDVHQTAETRDQASQHSLSSGYITSDNTEAASHTAATVEAVQLSKEVRQVGSQESLIPLDTDCLAEGTGTVKGFALASEVNLDTARSGSGDPGVCEVPYRMSLQNLLKQSQEYRQRQRQLRMAKNLSQETDEAQNLSDKENNEVPLVEKNELRKSKARRANHAKVRFSQFDPSSVSVAQQPPFQTLSETPEVQSSVGTNLEISEKVFDCGSVNVPGNVGRGTLVSAVPALSLESSEPDGLVGDNLTPSTARDDPASDLSQPLTTTSSSAEPCGLSVGPKIDGTVPNQVPASKKFTTFPTPQLCLSPVHCGKGRGPIAKLLVNTTLSVSDNAGLPARTKDGVDRAVQISQLEMNLSRLQALISDLESTLDEGSTCQTWAKGSHLRGEWALPARELLGLTEHRQPKSQITSISQKMRVPEMFRDAPVVPRRSPVLTDSSNRPPLDDSRSPSDRSCDVETPSSLWQWGEETGARTQNLGSPVDQGPGMRAKRRLLMSTAETKSPRMPAASHSAAWGRPRSSTPKVQTGTWARLLPKETQLHVEAPIKEQEREQLQRIAARYQCLRHLSPRSGGVRPSGPPGVPVLGPPAVHDLGSQISCRLSSPWRPLVAAAVKGYLTRRLLRSEHVAQLQRTVKDSQHFLLAFQPRTAETEEFDSEQDLELQKRVLLQLRSARYEIYDIFFSSSAAERMQIISWDRALIWERELRRRENGQERRKGGASLSAATEKSLERRRRSSALHKMAVEGRRVAGAKAGWRRACQHPRPR